MSKHLILSNKSWFIKYCRLRTICFILAILLIIVSSLLFDSFEPTIVSIFIAIGISLLLTILLFDYLQTPSFIELLQLEQGLELRLYIPDTHYLVNFKESKVKNLILGKEDQLIFQQYKGAFSLLDQFDFVIKRKDGTLLKTDKINVGWMDEAQKHKLKSVIDQYNIRSWH